MDLGLSGTAFPITEGSSGLGILEVTDPTTVALMRRIRTAFDPTGILNPGLLST